MRTGRPIGRPPVPPMERFQNFVEPEPNSGCLLWLGGRDADGYGHFVMKGVGRRYNCLAHRASYVLHRGQIPAGAKVLHTCDTPPCVNPSHLFLGTSADNNADMKRKGRQRNAHGFAHGMAKLTAVDFADVLRLRRSGLTQGRIATRLGISQSHISRIINRNTWIPDAAEEIAAQREGTHG